MINRNRKNLCRIYAGRGLQPRPPLRGGNVKSLCWTGGVLSSRRDPNAIKPGLILLQTLFFLGRRFKTLNVSLIYKYPAKPTTTWLHNP
jgi:hypothetical protein